MPNHERDKAIKRLRSAAVTCLAEARHIGMTSLDPVKLGNAALEMNDAWRSFPECEQDETVPSPEEVIARCDAYDRQKEEQERILARESQC